MASIQRRQRDGRTGYRVRYRTPSGVERSRTFARRADAERFRASVETAKNAGTYIDPARARLTVGEWGEKWLAGQAHLKPSSYARAGASYAATSFPRGVLCGWARSRTQTSRCGSPGWLRPGRRRRSGRSTGLCR
jgi:hypothetical protein